jgi:hypothetical protein
MLLFKAKKVPVLIKHIEKTGGKISTDVEGNGIHEK